MKRLKKLIVSLLITIIFMNNMPITLISHELHEHSHSGEVIAASNLTSEKYIVSEEEKIITRVLPETKIDTLKGKFNVSKSDIKIYNNAQEMVEVQDGKVATGMVLTYEGSDEKYIISVIGDIDGDGIMGEIELNLLIKNIVGLEERQFNNIETKSADINGDGKIDQIDITLLIRWIVYGELEIPEAQTSAAPIIKVIEGTIGENEWYTTNVKLSIQKAENDEVEIEKIVYTINDKEEKEIQEQETIELNEQGEYTIKASIYSVDGYKSKQTTKTIKIEKNIKQSEIETKVGTSKIEVNLTAQATSGIQNYTYYIGKIDAEGNIDYNKGITSKENTYTFQNLQENTKYSVKVEVQSKAGNTEEQEKQVQTKEIQTINETNLTITKTPENWTNGDVQVKIETSIAEELYNIEYSINNGETWNTYNEEVTITENTKMLIRLTDGTNHSNQIETEISNIDKTKPGGELKVENKSTKEIKIAILDSKDTGSGIEKYTYYIGQKDEKGQIEYTKVEEGLITEYTYTKLTYDQEYAIKVEIQDMAGNITKLEKTVRTNKMPEIGTANIQINYSTTEWTNENVQVTIQVDTNGIDLEECKLEYSIDSGKTWKTYEKIVNIEIEENTDIIVRISDDVNEITVATGKITNIDKVKPEGTIEINEIKTNKIEFELKATDNLSQIKKYTYYLGTENQKGEIQYESKKEVTEITNEEVQEIQTYEKLNQETKYYIKVEIEDNAGNVTEIIKEVETLKIPKLDDTNSKIDVSTEEWSKEDVIITVTPNKEIKENFDIEYSKDGGETWEKYDEETGIIVDENGTIIIRPTDGTNVGETIEIEITNIDKTAPEVEVEATEVTTKTITVEASATDEQSGIVPIYTYYIGTEDENGNIEYLKQLETPETTHEFTELEDAKEYYIKVEVADSVGNIGKKEIKVQTKEMPVGDTYIKITESTTDWTNQNIYVTISYSQNPYEVEYSLDGTNWVAMAETKKIFEFEENDTIYARLSDGLNRGELTKLEVGNIDKEKPTIENYAITGITSDEINLELNLKDNLSGISSITWYIKEKNDTSYKEDKETYKVLQGTVAGKTELTSKKQYKGLEEGTYHIYALIYDVSGNKIVTEEKVITLNQVSDLNVQNAKFVYTPTVWTNQGVKVFVETTVEGYNIEYSTDTINWVQQESITVQNNTTVYARLTDGVNVGSTISATIKNIDTKKPDVGSIQIQERTSNKITASIQVEDSESGLGKIEWYYKLDSESGYTKIEKDYQTLNGEQSGETQLVEKTLELPELVTGTYAIYAKVYDVAGNATESQVMIIGTTQIPDATENLTMTPSTKNWTNQDVIVTLSTEETKYTIEYSLDGTNWEQGTNVIIQENGTVYARLTDGINVGKSTSISIENIDKTNIEIGTIELTEVTSKGITVQVKMQDKLSGIAKVQWYYKNITQDNYTQQEQEYQVMNGTQRGENIVVTKQLKLEDLQSGTYSIYAVIYDVAGNSMQTENIEIATISIPTADVNLVMTATPTGWTNKSVTVNLVTNIEGYTIQSSTDKKTWANGTSATLAENGTVYGRLWDGLNEGANTSIEISNIDKIAPIINKQIASSNITTRGFTLSLSATDTESGISQIEWYYKLSGSSTYKKQTSEYTKMNSSTTGDTTQVSKTIEITNLESGTYNAYAIVYDVAGNSTQTQTIEVTTKEIPEGSLNLEMTPSTNNWTNKDVTVYVESKVTDYDIQCSTDQKTWTTGTNVTLSQNGTVYSRLWDGVNVGASTLINVTNIDKTAPTITTALNSSNITTKNFTLNIGTKDTASGISKIEWYYKLNTTNNYNVQTSNYTEMNSATAGETSTVTKSITIQNLTAGTYNAYAKIYDVAGNVTTSSEINITLKTVTALTTSNTTMTHSPSYWTNGNVTVTASTSLATGDFSIQTSTNGTTWVTTNSQTLTANGKVYARLWDGVNGGVATSTTVSKIDKTAPTISTALSSSNITSKGFSLNVGVTDTASGLSKIEWYYKLSTESNYTCKTTTYTAINGETAGTTTAVTKTLNITDLKYGTYNAFVKVYDVAGNVKSSSTINITLTKITLTLTPSTTSWTNGNVKVTLSTNITGYTPQYSTDGSTWTSGTSVTMSSNGTVYGKISDGTNETTASLKISNIDKTAPSAGLSVTSYAATTITVKATGSDTASGIKSYTFQYKLSTDSSYTTAKTVTSSATSYSYTFSGLTAGKTYNLKVIITDVAGNTANKIVTQITNTAPTTPTVTLSSKTTNSITVTAKSTDADGDKLTYKLYVGGTLKATSSSTASGTAVTLTATGLSEYTNYNYYVIVTDGVANTQNSSTSVRTYCSGTTYSCSGGSWYYCPSCDGDGGWYTTTKYQCSSCGGSGGTVCSTCNGKGGGYWGFCSNCWGYAGVDNDCQYCGGYGYIWESCKSCSSSGYISCSSCNGSGTISDETWTTCGNSNCVNGKIYYNCNHGYYNSHSYCDHSYNGTKHD